MHCLRRFLRANFCSSSACARDAKDAVLVRIVASGVNPLDVKIHDGAAAHARVQLPAILGVDVAGTVEAVAGDVTAFAPGDEVFGMIGGVGTVPGTLAEYALADARLLAHKPAARCGADRLCDAD